MPSKPGCYGISSWVLANSATHYGYNIIPYLVKEGDKAATNLGANFVKDLATNIFGSRRNITCDRYFTTVALFEELLQNRLTAVGTVMANRKHLPLQLLTHREKREILARVCLLVKKGDYDVMVSKCAIFVNFTP